LRYEVNQSIIYTIINGTKYFLIVILFSILIGYFFGYLTAFFLSKLTGKVKDIHKFEIGIMMILPWVSYLVAQVNKKNLLNLFRCLDYLVL
jgi:NhaP-type Na+/H+ or K+/H+ antiporter